MHEMNCDDVVKMMGDYLDRELSAEEKAKVERHLGECGGCTHAFRWEDSILRLVRDSAKVETPEGLMDRLMECCQDD